MIVMILIMKIISQVLDSYVKLLMIIIKNIVPIKDINSILKINKKVCSQVYLRGNVILLIKMVDNFLD